MKTLGDQIKMGRESRPEHKLSGEDLAKKLAEKTHVSSWTKQKISKIESGKSAPTLEEIFDIHEVLYADADPYTRDSTLRDWIVSAAMCLIATPDRDKANQILERIGGLFPASAGARSERQKTISLVNFPHRFSPLHIIAGDRREHHPKNRADLLCYSASMIDLIFVPRICEKLPGVRISSDKILYRMSEKWKKEELGKSNMLVIGSPAANLLARIVNKTAPFRFRLGKETREWQKIVESQEALALDDENRADAFAQIASNDGAEVSHNPADYELGLAEDEIDQLIELRRRVFYNPAAQNYTSLGEFMNEFRKAGFMDAATAKIHGSVKRINNDFGIISIAKNPFSDPNQNFVCIFAAGISGAGTASLVKFLAEADQGRFEGHPLGGVLEIPLLQNNEWAEIPVHSKPWFRTRPYDLDRVLRNIKSAHNAAETPAWANDLQKGELQEMMGFLDHIQRVNSA